MLRDTRSTDFSIECTDMAWSLPAHKLILSTGSPFFRAVIEDGFKESDENAVTIGESKPQTIAVVVASMYTSQLELDVSKIWPSDFFINSCPNWGSADHVLDVYLLADRLMAEKVKFLAQRKLLEILVQHCDIDVTFCATIRSICPYRPRQVRGSSNGETLESLLAHLNANDGSHTDQRQG